MSLPSRRARRGSRLALRLALAVAAVAPLAACATSPGSAPPAGTAAFSAAATSGTPRRAAPEAGTTLVLLVRHGEKSTAPAGDPLLSEAGVRRAEALKAALADAGVRHVIVSPFHRTKDTARPLAESLGLQPEVVALGSDGAAHVRAVAAAVRARPAGDVVLVVGHSNTIPAIVGALGGPRMADLCDAQYATLFVLALPPKGPARLIRSSYGAADAADAASCASNGMR